MKREKIAPPTLEQLRKDAVWLWVNCTNADCLHRAPLALTPLIIRWGSDACSDMLHRSVRCARCGRRGATLTMPSWAGRHVAGCRFR
jgi:hypothetical protein